MDVSDPTRSVTPSLDGPVLAVLASSGRPLTVGEIAHASVRGSEIGIRKCLARLVDQGIVRAMEMGRNRVHELNRDHIAAGIAVQLGELRLEFLKRLRGELSGWNPKPVSAWLFGSAARADGDESSDIDLLLVRGLRAGEAATLFDAPQTGWLGALAGFVEFTMSSKVNEQNPWLKPHGEAKWQQQVDRLHNLVLAWTGNRAQIVELTTNEMFEQRRRGTPLLQDVDREGLPLVEHPMIHLQVQGS